MGSIRVLRTWEAHPALRDTVRRELAAIHAIARASGFCRVTEWSSQEGDGAGLSLLFEFRDHAALCAWSELTEVRRWSARLQSLAERDAQRVLTPAPVSATASAAAIAAV